MYNGLNHTPANDGLRKSEDIYLRFHDIILNTLYRGVLSIRKGLSAS